MGGLIATVAGFALVSVGAAAPVAAEDSPIIITFNPPAAMSIEYGEYWSFPITVDASMGTPTIKRVESPGLPSGYMPSFEIYYQPQSGYTMTGAVGPQWDARPLPVGLYSFTAIVESDVYTHHTGETPIRATLTVSPAKVGVEVRVTADPSDPSNSIVTARFTGSFVDNFVSSVYPGAAQSPAGTWKLIIADTDGDVVEEREITREIGDDVLATSFVWTDARPGEEYTASATFTPTGPSATNFAIAPAAEFGFTGSETVRPIPSSEASAEPDTTIASEPDFSVPLWWVILIGVVLAALIAFAVVFAIRLGRSPRPTTGSSSTIQKETQHVES